VLAAGAGGTLSDTSTTVTGAAAGTNGATPARAGFVPGQGAGGGASSTTTNGTNGAIGGRAAGGGGGGSCRTGTSGAGGAGGNGYCRVTSW
jgi:hypothetical protein